MGRTVTRKIRDFSQQLCSTTLKKKVFQFNNCLRQPNSRHTGHFTCQLVATAGSPHPNSSVFITNICKVLNSVQVGGNGVKEKSDVIFATHFKIWMEMQLSCWILCSAVIIRCANIIPFVLKTLVQIFPPLRAVVALLTCITKRNTNNTFCKLFEFGLLYNIFSSPLFFWQQEDILLLHCKCFIN